MKDTWPLLDKIPFPAIARGRLTTLQVNVGYRCNQSCVHCHVNAGPNRTEELDGATADVVIDFLERRNARQRIGFVGNSIGGSFAMAMASIDKRVAACVCNGGVIKPTLAQGKTTFFAKMVAAWGTGNEEEALSAWRTIFACSPPHPTSKPSVLVPISMI